MASFPSGETVKEQTQLPAPQRCQATFYAMENNKAGRGDGDGWVGGMPF